MSSLWLNPKYVSIRNYGATVKGAQATVRVEIVVSEPSGLGFLLEDLARVKAEIEADRKTQAKRAKSAASTTEPVTIEHRKTLALPYFGDDQ